MLIPLKSNGYIAGVRRMYFGGGGDSGGGSRPDPLIGQAAMKNAQISEDALNWYKEQWAEGKTDRDFASNIANENATADLGLKKKQLEIADQSNEYYNTTFKPLEQDIVKSANEYDTPERRALAVSNAIAGVDTQMAAAKAGTEREVFARGGDPTSGNFIATNGLMDVNAAAAKAAAGNKAILDMETMGTAKKMDAVSLGRNLPSNQIAQASSAIAAGNAATNSAVIPSNVRNAAQGVMGQGFNTAIQGNASAAGILNQQYATQANADAQARASNNSVWGALGGVAGQFAGSAAGSKWIVGLSDENMKKDIVPTEPEDALKAVKETPVSEWSYKEGVADGGIHVGPMAQDVQATMGDKVAPDGKQIDLISMNGITMAAIQALSNKVDKLAKGAKA